MMLLAVGMDAENGILPIAYGICKSETTVSWTWFFEKLYELIGDIEGLTFISDRAASIETSLTNVFPTAYHGYCCHHLLSNLKAKFKDDDKTKGLYWKMCKAYTENEFNTRFEAFGSARPREHQLLLAVGPQKWSRALFPGNRYNCMTSNSAESINALSRHARSMPVTMLIDFFRATMQQWYFQRRNDGEANKEKITRWAENKVAKRQDDAKTCSVHPISQFEYEVRERNVPYVANISERQCACQKWQKSAIPCCHAIAIYRYLNQSDCNSAVYTCYTTKVYRETYKECVYPLPPPTDWEMPADLMIVKPPVIDKRQPGRPKNKDRIPSQGETPKKRKCGRCGTEGHRRENCMELIPSKPSTSSKSASNSYRESVDLRKF